MSIADRKHTVVILDFIHRSDGKNSGNGSSELLIDWSRI